MSTLDDLVRDASAAAGGMARVIPIQPAGTPEAEAARMLQICNACRYCEGFCAVFPAMTICFDELMFAGLHTPPSSSIASKIHLGIVGSILAAKPRRV